MFQHLPEPHEPRENNNGSVRSGTHTLFGLPDPDNLVDPNSGELSAITAPGDVRHYVRGRYLDVPRAKRREVRCLTETNDGTCVNSAQTCRKAGS